MGWQPEWRVTCDQCSARGPARSTSQEAEQKATQRGWIAWEGFYGSFHACPKCAICLNPELADSLANSDETRKWKQGDS